MVGFYKLLMLVVAGRVAFLIQWRVADIAVWYIEYIVHYLKNWGFLILGNKKEGVCGLQAGVVHTTFQCVYVWVVTPFL